jgi:hypothetical protein
MRKTKISENPLYNREIRQSLNAKVEDSPVFVAGGAMVLASLFIDKDKMVAAMGGNGALAWGDHYP